MTPGGAALVGTTVLVAAMDGGLSALVFGVASGAAAYVATRRTSNQAVEGVVKAQMADWEERIAEATDEEERKRLRNKMAAAEKTCRARLQCNREYVKWVAAAVGVGVAMAPGAGVAVAALYTRKRWMPPLVAVWDVARDRARAKWDAEHSLTDYAPLYRTMAA